MRLLPTTLRQRLLHLLLTLRQRRQPLAEAARHRRQFVARVAAGIWQSEAGETMTEAQARQYLRRWLPME